MLSNDIIKVPLATEWAIIKPFGDNRKKHETSIPSTDPRRVEYATRVSNNKYALKTRNGRSWSEDANDFYTTQERSYGYLVKLMHNGNPIFVVSKPVNFVSTRTEYDLYWDAEKERREQAHLLEVQEAEIRSRRAELRRTIRLEREAQAKPEAERTAEAVTESIGALLGQRTLASTTVKVAFDGTWEDEDSDDPKYTLRQNGTVTMTLQNFQRLLEKAMQE